MKDVNRFAVYTTLLGILMINEEQWRIIDYLNFKMECIADQETLGIPLDYEKVLRHIQELEAMKGPKVEELKAAMPKVPKISIKSRPKVLYKKDQTLSIKGQQWFNLLRENKLPVTHREPVEVITGYELANPSSPDQVKAWLYSLGWKPCTFKYVRSGREERKIPQVRYFSPSHPKKGELTESVLKLKEKDPNIEILEGLTIIEHRLSVFKGFRDKAYQRDGKWFVDSSIGGLTNTLRFKHRAPIANLPKVGVPWGEEIRGCLVCLNGHTLVGSDMVSLESTTKRHYMQPIDPDYVEEMSQPGFDEHLDLAVHAGAITQEQADKHSAGEINLKPVRDKFKPVNYSAIYGIQPPKLSRETGLTLKEAEDLLEAYWERNKAVKQVIKEQYVKTLPDGSMWLKNPVSGFYISLRYEKDIFSSLNQSTGVYCFDTWVAFCRSLGVKSIMQYHDEQLIHCSVEDLPKVKRALQEAIEKTNNKVKLNVELSVDIQSGDNYASVH